MHCKYILTFVNLFKRNFPKNHLEIPNDDSSDDWNAGTFAKILTGNETNNVKLNMFGKLVKDERPVIILRNKFKIKHE